MCVMSVVTSTRICKSGCIDFDVAVMLLGVGCMFLWINHCSQHFGSFVLKVVKFWVLPVLPAKTLPAEQLLMSCTPWLIRVCLTLRLTEIMAAHLQSRMTACRLSLMPECCESCVHATFTDKASLLKCTLQLSCVTMSGLLTRITITPLTQNKVIKQH